MLIPANAHVALADGERFLLMRNTGSATEARLELVAEPGLQDEDESGARGHHDPRSDDYHEQDRLDHAASAAGWLNRQVLQHRIERLILVAAPDTLGEMRRHLHKETQGVVIEEIAKQLTGLPGPEIVKAIEAV